MTNKARLIMYISISGLFLLLDQTLKYLARVNFDFTYYIWRPWLGWEYFGNSGIAFSLPIPNWLVVIFTPFVLLGFILWLVSLRGGVRTTTKQSQVFATCLIIAGALSNYIDRVLFGVTIDYLRILTGIINLADVMIVGGVALLLFHNKRNKNLQN